MAHILTDAEALKALNFETAEEVPNMELLLSAVDDGIKLETGFDFAETTENYTSIDPTAKLAASIALVAMFDGEELPKAYNYKIAQLAAKAKELKDAAQ